MQRPQPRPEYMYICTYIHIMYIHIHTHRCAAPATTTACEPGARITSSTTPRAMRRHCKACAPPLPRTGRLTSAWTRSGVSAWVCSIYAYVYVYGACIWGVDLCLDTVSSLESKDGNNYKALVGGHAPLGSAERLLRGRWLSIGGAPSAWFCAG